MTELKAYLLIFGTMIVAQIGSCLILGTAGASGTAIALATVLIAGAAAHASSLVVMHYGSSRRPR